MINRYFNYQLLLPLILICYIVFSFKFVWQGIDGKGYSRILSGDGKGYYLHLNNFFIEKNYDHQPSDDRYIFTTQTGKGVNKYYVGTAICIYPFFQMSQWVNYFFYHSTLAGFDKLYQLFVLIASYCYFLLGLYFLSKLLRAFTFESWIVYSSVFFVCTATNLMIYVAASAAMSHVYSFSVICIFLYLAKLYFLYHRRLHFYLCVLLLAIIVLIRPVNVMVLAVLPFMATSWKAFVFSIQKNSLKHWMVGAFLFGMVVFIQPLSWYWQCGNWMVWSYQKEGFNFLDPEVFRFLFSFRKGLFVYTPILFISLIGFFHLWQNNRFQFFSLLFFIFLLVYVLSSWWNWYYGPSFGQRPIVDYLSVFALLIAFSLKQLKRKTSYGLMFTFLMFSCLNLIQSYQYQYGIMSSWDMNFRKYAHIFLKTSSSYVGHLGGNKDISYFRSKPEIISQYTNDFEKGYDDWKSVNLVRDTVRKSQVCNYANQEFNLVLEPTITEPYITKRELFAKVHLDVLEQTPMACTKAYFVISVEDSLGERYHYYSFPINEVPNQSLGKWDAREYSIKLIKLRSLKDKMQFYVWNQDKGRFLLDNVSISIYDMH